MSAVDSSPARVTDLNVVATEPLPTPEALCGEIARSDAGGSHQDTRPNNRPQAFPR